MNRMNLKKGFFMLVLTGALTLSFLSPTFSQVKPGKKIVASGAIEHFSRDRKLNADYMMINERKILVSRNTKIIDEWGNALTLKDLKPGVNVVVEDVRHSGGTYERKIIVKR